MQTERAIICEEIVRKSGSFRTIRRWYHGWSEIKDHSKPSPQRTSGWTGQEEFVELDTIRPIIKVEIKNETASRT